MSEREILSWLKYDDYRAIVETCETTPKSAKDIAKSIGKSISEVAEMLATLEDCKAIEYTEEGWKATELAIKVLNKYFR